MFSFVKTMFISWMLIMVIAKPIQFTMVSEDPFRSAATFCATKVENNGESAITAMLHISRKIMKTVVESWSKKKGEMRQQMQETVNAKVARFFVPNLFASMPLITQERLPTTIIKKDVRGTFNCVL